MIKVHRSAVRLAGFALLAAGVLACGSTADRDDAATGAEAPGGATTGAPSRVVDASRGPADGLRLDDAAPAATATPANVRGCEVTAATLGFNLDDPETYSATLYPIVTRSCAKCHAGDQDDKANSTTCGYLEKNIDNVIKRLQNSLLADAALDVENAKDKDDPTKLDANKIEQAYTRTEWPMPRVSRNRNQNPAVTQDEINLFIAWKDVPNKCVATDVAADPTLPDVTVRTNDEDTLAAAAKMFETSACEDGPAVAADYAKVASLMALPEGAASTLYDYEKKDYVAGATALPGDCTIDAIIAYVKNVAGAEAALTEYKNYGWQTIQCSLVDGKLHAHLVQLARVPNTLGDKVYGVYVKDISIEQRP